MNKTMVTVTVNPAIDGASDAERVRPTRKIRTGNERFAPGGGGINVARVLTRLGEPACALYLAGGATGALLEALVEREGIRHHALPIAGDTRISHAVYERATGHEFRFVPEGPEVREGEWQALLAALAARPFDIMIASGSLSPGMPDDFHARLLPLARAQGARLVLDSSGPALAQAVRAGGLWMIKPSHGEFEALIGRRCARPQAIGEAAQALVRQGAAEIVVVSLGQEGAVYADRDGYVHRAPPDVAVHSAVGAGDSFVGGMVHKLAQGWPPQRAFLYGMAAGTAAVLTPGTELCRPEDVERLFVRMESGG